MKLEVSYCKECKQAIFPPRDICPYCGPSAKMIPQEIQNRGIVVSFTTLRKPPEGFEPPLTLALVELKHGAHVLCLLADETDLSKVEIGKDAILSFDDQNRLRFVPS